MMKWLILTVLLVVALFALGWLYVENEGNRTELILDGDKVQQDTSSAVTTGRQAIENLGDSLESAGDDFEKATDTDTVEDGDEFPEESRDDTN